MHVFFNEKFGKIWKKVNNIIKKISSEIIYNKKYLKDEKSVITKKLTHKKNALKVFIYQ